MSATPRATWGEPVDQNWTSIRLTGSRDKSSGKGVFPAIPDASPAAARYEPLVLAEEAELYSYTIIHPNPKSGRPCFILAYVDFPEEVRVFGRLQMAEGARPQIGMRLRVVTPAGAGHATPGGGYLFIPARETFA